jgi:NADH-quinone oxidoreductase subunit J
MFFAFALLTLAGALAMLLQKNVIEAGLAMALSFFGVAGLFILLANPVAGALQIIVYAGAILVLVLFVIMLLNAHEEEKAEMARPFQRWVGAAVAGVLGLALVRLIFTSPALSKLAAVQPAQSAMTLEKVGEAMFQQHLLSFEVVGLLLLAAMIGAVTLTKKDL